MTRVLGFDPSFAAFGIADIDTQTGRAFTKTIAPPKELIGGARLSWLRVALLDELRRGVDAVGMEGYALSMPGRNTGKDTSQLMEMGGVIKEVCAHRGIPLRVITSSQVKKWATGRGDGNRAALKLSHPELSAGKLNEMVKAVCLSGMRELWQGTDIDNADCADALAIAHIVMMADCVDLASCPEKEMTPAQWEVIRAIAKPKKKPTRKAAAKKGIALL